jgi:hypothetical protein
MILPLLSPLALFGAVLAWPDQITRPNHRRVKRWIVIGAGLGIAVEVVCLLVSVATYGLQPECRVALSMAPEGPIVTALILILAAADCGALAGFAAGCLRAILGRVASPWAVTLWPFRPSETARGGRGKRGAC